MITIPAPWLALHRAAVRSMLASERTALTRLRTVLARMTLAYAAAARGHDARGALLRAARELEAAVEAEHLRARAAARRAAHESLLAEWALMVRVGAGRGLPSIDVSPRLVPAADEDALRARAAAGSFARDWLAAADAALAAGAPAPLRTASARISRRVEMQAATETADAFGAERETETTRLAHDERARRWAPLLLKIWDATLDQRTCSTCRDLEGQVRPWGVPFSGGQRPGSPHPGCRCLEVTIFAPITWRAEEKKVA